MKNKQKKIKLLEYVTYSQVVKDIESAKEFCRINKIKPEMVIVVWEEKNEQTENRG